MAMNKVVLGALMQSKIDALSANDKKDRSKVFQALADAVIAHIQDTATLSGLVVVGTSATGGPVTGTATGAPGSIL